MVRRHLSIWPVTDKGVLFEGVEKKYIDVKAKSIGMDDDIGLCYILLSVVPK